MKFGKHIQAQTIPEWAAHYMSYKSLKKIINELTAPLTPGLSQSEAALQRLNTVKAAFFFQLDRELEKVNLFYLQKEADYKVRLKSLIDKQRSLRSRGPRNRTATIRALREAFLQSRHDLDKLQNFVEINGTGFRKILKKWDKRSKSSTKELYLARQVEVQPCFNQDVIAELSDTVTQCLSELENALEETELMAPTALPTQLDLISSPSLRASLNLTSSQATHSIGSTAPAPPSISEADTEDIVPDDAAASGAAGIGDSILQGIGLSRSVQLDRMEAELFQAISQESSLAATEILELYKIQRRDEQRACVTRVLWRACAELKSQATHQQLIDTGLADLRSADDINERTLAHEAAIHGSLAILKATVEAGCNVDDPDYYERRPVHYAAINGHADCVEYLVSQGCDAGSIDDDGNYPFNYAIISGDEQCARLLLDYDRNTACGTPDHPMLILACQMGQESIVVMLLDAGVEIVSNSQGVHPAHVSARAGFASILKLLLSHGASVDVVDKDLGWTPVFYAASEGNTACIRLLLEAGCDLDVVDEAMRSPLYYAASEGHMDCVDLLLEAAKAKQTARAEATSDVDVQTQLAGKMGGVLLSGSPAQSQQAQHDAGVPDHPKDGIAADAAMSMDLDLDLDGIPSLALPPPLIPFRIYGHNFLGKRTRIQIRMHTHRAAGGPPIAFSDDRDMISLKLVVVAKPDAGMVPHTVMLPLETPSTIFGFQTDDPSQFRLEFQLYPSFGLQPMGKAIAMPSLFASSSAGIARLPLLDRYLKLVAEVSFEFLAIRPFEGAQLQIGGKVETYWKSTNPAPRPNPGLTPTVGLSPRLNTITTPGATVASGLIGSPHSVAESVGPSGQNDAGMSLVVSSSLAPEHVCVQVQVCMDGVPVICPREAIQTGGETSISVRVCDLRHTEFARMIKTTGVKPTGDSPASAWHSYIRDAGLTLREVLEMLPIRLGLSIQVMYSTNQKSGNAISSGVRFGGCDVNEYIDSILKTVYDDSHKRARAQPPAPPHNASTSILERVANDLYRKDTGQRNIIFCSYSAQVCMALNWKQPNYAVFILTSGRQPLDPATVDAPSFNSRLQHLSLKESVRFACDNNLLGIMCDASLLTRVPSLIANVKNNGLFLISFGANNGDQQMCAEQKAAGVDAIMHRGAIKYEAEHAEYAI